MHKSKTLEQLEAMEKANKEIFPMMKWSDEARAASIDVRRKDTGSDSYKGHEARLKELGFVRSGSSNSQGYPIHRYTHPDGHEAEVTGGPGNKFTTQLGIYDGDQINYGESNTHPDEVEQEFMNR